MEFPAIEPPKTIKDKHQVSREFDNKNKELQHNRYWIQLYKKEKINIITIIFGYDFWRKASLMVLTAIGPSTRSRGTFGKTTDPSEIAYTSTSEQSIPPR